MRIHQACQASGLTRKAILYYERQGLIQPSLRENGYRDFSRDDVESLKRIALLRRLGLSLEQVRTALDSPDGIKDAARRLRLQWAEYQERMELLDTWQKMAILIALRGRWTHWKANVPFYPAC